ncbi:prepilin peptidase [Amycolatopsis sp. K13G38]|uniref:Prepilin peptidase n=1 Tax=Amycolatopsis acididurans TaxID=2724524 RepID=A0ABX1J1N6_9PSEU|nr:A24 family peptidase [Amycolatopsis acididurans]NKQ53683.1 prepilin peptidase [Amycolatopsis acididurans]
MTWGLLLITLLSGAAAGLLTSFALSRARAPAPVPTMPVAVSTGLLCALVAWRCVSGSLPSWWLPVPLLVTLFAVPLFVADIRHRRLPNVLTLPAYPAAGVALVIAGLTGPGMGLMLRALAAAVVFGGLHLMIHALSRRSLGGGDVKLAGVLGAVLGAVSCAALILGALVASLVTLLLTRARRWRDGVPHGPGLLLASWLVTVFPATAGEVGTGA